VMVMMDTCMVVDVLCGVMCLISSARYIFRRLSAILSSDFVVRFCLLNAKPTRTRVLGTNQRSRARLISFLFQIFWFLFSIPY
jgi:hypothetical protein